MKKNRKTIIFIIICLVMIELGIALGISLSNKKYKEEKIPFDETYWKMKDLYTTNDRFVDIVNNDKYYTVNIYSKNTSEIIETFDIDATTGKITNKSVGMEATASMEYHE